MSLRALLRTGRRLRTLGIDDGPFVRGGRAEVLVVGAIYSGGELEGLLSARIRQDGRNATDRLICMVRGSKFQAQLHLVLLDGITLGGLNLVDLPRLAEELELPCAAVMRRPPDLPAFLGAIDRLPRSAERRRLLERAGSLHRAGACWFQVAGGEAEEVGAAISATLLHGGVPECLRGAHLIASGIVTGVSGRRA